MGRSGSGKGTQIELLKNAYLKNNAENTILHYEAGNVFREIIQSGSYTGGLIKNATETGILVPDFVTNGVFVSRMVEHMNTKDQLLIFDGYPRSCAQADVLDETLKYYGRTHAVVLHIDVSEEEVRNRMALRGRYDDAQTEVLENRMRFYREHVLPTLERYRDQDFYTVIDVNGEGDVDEIHHEIMEKLASA